MKKSIVHTPHDKLIRSSLQYPEVAREFLELYLPEDIKKRLDFNSIVYCPTTFIDERLKLSQTDVLFKAKIDGKQAYIYFLTEHESKVDHLIAFWLIKYMVSIWDYHIKEVTESKALPLPMIIPMVFYTGGRNYTAHRELWKLFGEHSERMKAVFQSPFHLIEVEKRPIQEFTSHIFAGTMGFMLREYFRKHTPQELLKIIDNFNALEQCKMHRYLVELIQYLFSVDECHRNTGELIEIIHDKMSPSLEKTMSSLAEKLIKEGELKGEIKGELRGKLAGKLDTAKNMLADGVEPAFVAKYTALPLDEIKKLQKNVH